MIRHLRNPQEGDPDEGNDSHNHRECKDHEQIYMQTLDIKLKKTNKANNKFSTFDTKLL